MEYYNIILLFIRLKGLLLPTEEAAKGMLRTAFFAQQKCPDEKEVVAALPTLASGRLKVKSLAELEEDVDRLVAIKDVSTTRRGNILKKINKASV